MTKVHLVHAFLAESGEGGNLAGVVLDAEGLDDARMQQIAAKVGASETAFVLPSRRAKWRLRYFTPEEEVPLCGHATLAAFHTLAAEGRLGDVDGIHRTDCETAAGVVNVDIHGEEGKVGRVAMTQAKPEIVVPRMMLGEVAMRIGVERAKIEKTGAPVQIVSTGLRHVVVPMPSREALAALAPPPTLGEWLQQKQAHTLHAYAIVQSRPSVRIAQRSFAPHLGIPEDPATGTATGAVAAYLLFNHLVPGSPPVVTIRAEQGVEMGKPSFLVADVHVEAHMNGLRPTKVKVGGRSKTVGDLEA